MSDRSREHIPGVDADDSLDAVPGLSPGKRSLTMGAGPRQEAASAGKVTMAQQIAPGAPLDADIRTRAESSLGVGFGGVRVHQDADAARAAGDVGARAFALGSSIFLGPGESATDLPLMAHELAHVVQQRDVPQPAIQYLLRDATTSQPGDALEAEADRAADAIVAGRPAQVIGAAPAGVIHRRVNVTPVASRVRPDADIPAMTVHDFLDYTSRQADWSTHYNAADEPQVRQLLMDLLADPALAAGTDQLRVSAILALSAADRGHLQRYCDAVHHAETVPTAKVARTADLARALEIGRTLPRLETAVNGGGVLYHITAPDSVDQLISQHLVDAFIGYCTQKNPQWQAPDGKEFESFFAMPPYFHLIVGPMLPDVRNLHHFDFAALIRLAVDRLGGHAGQPLALILHSGLDWNGAFHHDGNLTNAIVNNPNRVVMIEGRATLDSITNDLPGIAASYGGGSIDQVMIAGHGDSHVIELAGSRSMGTDDSGRPEVYGNDDTVDLEHNREATERFFDRLIPLMNGPNRRIVLNACLTASNDIDVRPGSDPATQIADHLRTDPSLADFVRQRVDAAVAAGTAPAAGVDVVGANASFPEGPALMDGAGRFDIIWSEDPALTTSDRGQYIRTGIEPTGVLRAILTTWEAPPASGPVPTWLQAVNDRMATDVDTWPGRIIQACLGQIQARPRDAGLISQLAEAADLVAHAYWADTSHVSDISGVPARHRPSLFGAVEGCSEWPGADDLPPLGIYQLWARTDSSKYQTLLAHITAKSLTSSQVEGYFDFAFLGSRLIHLLPPGARSAPTHGHFVVAFAAVLDGGAPAPARDFLRHVVRANGNHLPASAITILDNSSEDDVLRAIGMGGGGAATSGGDMDVEGNVDGNTPDGTNDRWVERIARNGTVVNTAQVNVRSGPGTGAPSVGTLNEGDTVFVFGVRGPWYAVDFNGATGYVRNAYLMLT